MFNKEQIYFLGDFLADSLSDIYEEISDNEKIIDSGELSNKED